MSPPLLVGCRQRGWYATHSVICGINDNILLPRGSLWWDCDGWWQHRMYILTKVDAAVIYKAIFSYGMQMCEIQIFRPYCLIYLCLAKSLSCNWCPQYCWKCSVRLIFLYIYVGFGGQFLFSYCFSTNSLRELGPSAKVESLKAEHQTRMLTILVVNTTRNIQMWLCFG